MSPAENGDLLYVAGDDGRSYVLSYPDGSLVGTISGGAEGACSDAIGDVFLTQGDTVDEYSHGGTTPIKSLTLPTYTSTQGCSVDSLTGNLAVTAFGLSGLEVAVFQGASGNPTIYLVGALFCGYDNRGNLFVDSQLRSGELAIYELPKDGNAFDAVSVNPAIYGIGWQVQWDGAYITVEVGGAPAGDFVYRLSVSGSKATVKGRTSFKGILGHASQSWIAGNSIIMPVGRKGIGDRTNVLGIWKYPAGGKPTAKLRKIGGIGKQSYMNGVTLSIATRRYWRTTRNDDARV